MTETPSNAALPAEDHAGRDAHLPGLLTIRVIDLLDLLRRSGTLANKREFGLSGIEWRIMSVTGGHAPLSLNDLSDLLALDSGQVSRAVKVLVERGLLDRKRKPGGPSIVITLTAEGTVMHDRMVELAVARNEFLVEGIPKDEIARVAALLDIVKAKATALLEQERSYGGLPGDAAE